MLAANNMPLVEPNVLYLEEKPPKTVTQKKATRASKSRVKKKTIAKTKKTKNNAKKSKLLTEITVKKEEMELEPEKPDIMDPNDPLYTPEVLIKCEISETELVPEDLDHKKYLLQEDEKFYFDSDTDECELEDEDYQDDFRAKNDAKSDDDESFDANIEEEENDDDDDEEEEDEPLILLTKTKGGRTGKKYNKAPRFQTCLDTCKLKCIAKFANDQRRHIYDYYSNLSNEVKMQFIRKHTKKRILSRIRNKKRNNNCCYYMKYYKPNDTIDCWMNPNKETDNDGNLTKVCRKFFQGTLGLRNNEIKEAIDGYELEQEKMIIPIIKKEEKTQANIAKVKTQKPQLFLDPETGNLTNSKPKTKRKRRKPGEPERERFPRPINCAIRCIYKCHENFSEQERKQICDMFWSLDFKRRKDFILARIETKDVLTPITPEFRKTNRPTRAYQTRFYLRSGIHSENKRVCKHFMMNTLCINRKFIENAIQHADKTTGNYVGVDGRGKHLIHKINLERKQGIVDHINSFPLWRPNKKSKLRCLHNSLSIKKMFKEYKEKCETEQSQPVSAFYYYKVFHDDFNLKFLSHKDPKKAPGFLNINPNLSHYTGDEPGGSWVDSKGNPLDVSHINPAESIKTTSIVSPTDSSNAVHQAVASNSLDFNQSLNFATAAAAHHLANFVDPTLTPTGAPRVIFQTSAQNLYDNNLPHSSASSLFRMI